MADRYGAWTKARLSAELRARGLPSRGARSALRERLRADDTGAPDEPEEAAADRDAPAADEARAGQADAPPPARQASGGREAEERSEVERHLRAGEGNGSAAGTAQTAPDKRREEPASREETGDGGRPGRAGLAGRLPRRAIEELQAITGRRVDRVVSLRSHDGGWRATIDVVEHARTPPSEDLVVSYRVSCDRRGQVRACRRSGAHVRAERQRRAQRP